jgi:hypothetical protein
MSGSALPLFATGLAALAACVAAALRPRWWTHALAVLTTAAGLGVTLPPLGGSLAAWSVALGFAALGLVQPGRHWPLLALPWLLAGATGVPWWATATDLTAGPGWTAAAWPALASIALACVVLAATTAAAWRLAFPGGGVASQGRLLALVLALLPWAPAGGSLLHGWSALALPVEGTAVAVQAWGSHGAALVDAPAWARGLQPAARLVLALGVWQPRWWRAAGGVAALALGIETVVALGLPRWHVSGQVLPVLREAGYTLDLSLLGLALARLLALGVLLRHLADPSPQTNPAAALAATATDSAGERSLVERTTDLATWLAGAGLALVWWLSAPDAGVGDPAAAALLAVLLAIGLARSLPRWQAVGRALAWLAALWLLGGADAGWRVAGALLR